MDERIAYFEIDKNAPEAAGKQGDKTLEILVRDVRGQPTFSFHHRGSAFATESKDIVVSGLDEKSIREVERAVAVVPEQGADVRKKVLRALSNIDFLTEVRDVIQR